MSNQSKGSRFTKEFKLEAIRLAKESGAVRATAQSLGLSAGTLYAWIQQAQIDQHHTFPGKGNLKPADQELRDLRLKVKKLEETNEILKKAAVYFASATK